jgi:hypothetical protein
MPGSGPGRGRIVISNFVTENLVAPTGHGVPHCAELTDQSLRVHNNINMLHVEKVRRQAHPLRQHRLQTYSPLVPVAETSRCFRGL